ncbi:hypothetical protein ACIA6D_42755 [Streptomyces cacaoi]|uniref:hypothetical protein n=1 Tax=Streptomyces cacaoi TaxID=1898 RepID=UPI003748FD81
MDELVRFVLQRPAQRPDSSEIKVLRPTFVEPGTDRPTARLKAREFAATNKFLRTPDPLTHAEVARAVAALLAPSPAETDAVRDVVHDHTGKTPEQVVADSRFASEEDQLANSLVAMKLLSDSLGADAPGLSDLARGYDAIRASASPVRECVQLRPLAQPLFSDPQLVDAATAFGAAPSSSDRRPAQPPAPSGPVSAPPTESPISSEPYPTDVLLPIDRALTVLAALPAASFQPPEYTVGSPSTASAEAQGTSPPEGLRHIRSRVNRPWTLTREAIQALPDDVRRTLGDHGADPATTGLPAMVDILHHARTQALRAAALAALPAGTRLYPVGSRLLPANSADHMGVTAAESRQAMALPTTRGNIRPAGIGDLLIVRQHTLRYEGGELAHVENVLPREKLNRETRRLQRTEATLVQESETTKTEERDSQTTDRFSLKRETSDTVKRDSEFKAGLAVTARYGPFIEVKANADYATKTATESSVRQATEFSKDLVNRSVSKVVERVLERRSVTTIEEFEEKYAHGMDNTAGTQPVSGVYQWIDEVVQAQVYNYGKRQLFDVVVPEPAAAYIAAEQRHSELSSDLVKPPHFPLTAYQIDEGNYLVWGQTYDVVDLEPPPPPYRIAGKSIAATIAQQPLLSSGTSDLPIEDGYRAKYLQGAYGYSTSGDDHDLWLVAGKLQDDLTEPPVPAAEMNNETEVLPVSYYSRNVVAFALGIDLYCEVTERATHAWQLKTHAKLTQGYLTKLKQYEQAVAEARSAAGAVVPGGNPGLNRKLVVTELRKQCLMLLTAQHFEGFGAIAPSSTEGYPEPDLELSAEQMPYVRFFEQAFEWEHLAFFYYPYFWGRRPGWQDRMLLDDTDPDFSDFLRAGAARVVFPVRPGFESAVMHFLETGEIWNGGPPPDMASPLYVPILKEIQEATGAPGKETAQGEPWLVRVPTTLVRLRPASDLPEWRKSGDDWVPVEQHSEHQT